MRPRTMARALLLLSDGEEDSSGELKPPSFQVQPRKARKESSWPEP